MSTLIRAAAVIGVGVILAGAAVRQDDAVTTHGEWVKYAKPGTRDTIRAYVAYPERKDKAPAVIVIHEVYGLTDWEPTVVDRLANNGLVAIVPDLLSSKHGRSPANPDSGRKLIGELEPARVTADLDATYAWIGAQPAVASERIGVIGFCWGGGQSFRYATNNPKLRAAVVCYGPTAGEGLDRIKSPILGVYGEDDARINQSLPATDAEMKQLGKRFDRTIYPGTGHGFLKPGRKGNDGPEPERAWEDIIAFYRRHLGK
ncbi:MAG: dienelactone hydrolase family protein [Gemmatimonadales bacterium]